MKFAGFFIASRTALTVLLGMTALIAAALAGSMRKNSLTSAVTRAVDHGAPLTPDRLGCGIARPSVEAVTVTPPNWNPVTSCDGNRHSTPPLSSTMPEAPAPLIKTTGLFGR